MIALKRIAQRKCVNALSSDAEFPHSAKYLLHYYKMPFRKAKKDKLAHAVVDSWFERSGKGNKPWWKNQRMVHELNSTAGWPFIVSQQGKATRKHQGVTQCKAISAQFTATIERVRM